MNVSLDLGCNQIVHNIVLCLLHEPTCLVVTPMSLAAEGVIGTRKAEAETAHQIEPLQTHAALPLQAADPSMFGQGFKAAMKCEA